MLCRAIYAILRILFANYWQKEFSSTSILNKWYNFKLVSNTDVLNFKFDPVEILKDNELLKPFKCNFNDFVLAGELLGGGNVKTVWKVPGALWQSGNGSLNSLGKDISNILLVQK